MTTQGVTQVKICPSGNGSTQLPLRFAPSMTSIEWDLWSLSRWPTRTCCGAAWPVQPEGGQATQRCPDCGRVLVETVARL